MDQYLKIINQAKRQYLEPFSMRASERFPAILGAEEMTRSLSWLVCASDNPNWRQLQRKNERMARLLSSWAGDKMEIIGDQNEEELSHLVKDNFKDISYEMVAILFEIDPDFLDGTINDLVQRKTPSHIEQLGRIMRLDPAPSGLEERLNDRFPEWRAEFERLCSTQIYDPRIKLKRTK